MRPTVFALFGAMLITPVFAQTAEAPKEPAKQPTVEVPEALAVATIGYLATRPYNEVVQLIEAWRAAAAKQNNK